jgi:hypothetical protein
MARAHTRPIFIGGMFKSGTTLFRAMLGQHPHIFSGLETHWFTPEIRERWRDTASQRMQWLREFYEVPQADLEALAARAQSGPDFISRFLGLLAARAGKRRWAEKTPRNIEFIEDIFRYWKDAQFIHVVRDPRDIYVSRKRAKNLTLDQFLDAMDTVFTPAQGYFGTRNERYMEIRYEDLVREPRSVMGDLLDFLDEPWDAAVARFEGAPGELKKVRALTGRPSTTLQSLSQPLHANAIGIWRTQIQPDELKILVDRLGPMYKKFGYDLGTETEDSRKIPAL